MKSYLVGLLLAVSVAAQSQNISGKVCLESDRSPVPYATVGLMQLPDSAMLTGVITLTDGGYVQLCGLWNFRQECICGGR